MPTTQHISLNADDLRLLSEMRIALMTRQTKYSGIVAPRSIGTTAILRSALRALKREFDRTHESNDWSCFNESCST